MPEDGEGGKHPLLLHPAALRSTGTNRFLSARSPMQMLPSALVRCAFGSLWLGTPSMLFHKSQPWLSGTAVKERKGLPPCAPVTKAMGKKGRSDSSMPA